MQISVYSISFGFSWGPIGARLQHAVIACARLLVCCSVYNCTYVQCVDRCTLVPVIT